MSLPREQVKEEKAEAGYSKQQLILGTHTSEGEQNYLMRAEVQLPLEETETDARYVHPCEGRWGLPCAMLCSCFGAAQVQSPRAAHVCTPPCYACPCPAARMPTPGC